MLLCEYCVDGAMHCSCHEPRYYGVPDCDWACPNCVDKMMEEQPSEHREEFDQLVAEGIGVLEEKWGDLDEILAEYDSLRSSSLTNSKDDSLDVESDKSPATNHNLHFEK